MEKKRKSYFHDDFDAAKKLNEFCDKLGTPSQNPKCCEIANKKEHKKTSQYKGAYWHRETGKWYVLIYLKGQTRKYGGVFKDELDAAKRLNQLCEELGIPLQNPEISAIPNEQYQKKEKTSQYKGVGWHRERKKWRVQLSLKGEKPKNGGYFNVELDAAKRVNQLCNELGIPPQNPTISAITNQQYQKIEKKSQYKGVYWHRDNRKWYVLMSLKGEKQKYGGQFNDELDAAKKVNQLCEELGIRFKNPTISAISNQQNQHGDYQNIENPVISCEILKPDNDHVTKKKRKRKQEFNDDDKRSYFYENRFN